MHTVIDFLADLEKRIHQNGGNPVLTAGALMQIICYMRDGKFTNGNGPVAIGRRHLVTISKLKRRLDLAVTEHVAFKLNSKPWVTRTLQEYSIERMESSHIQNTIRMIKDGRMKRPGCSGLTNQEWVRIFENELILRASKQASTFL